MAASRSGSLECEEDGLPGSQVNGRSEPTSRRTIAAWISISIAFVISVGIGLFVLGPFEAIHAMVRPDVKNFAVGLGLHHEAPFARMKHLGQVAASPHQVAMNPGRTTAHAAVKMSTHPIAPLAEKNHDQDTYFHKNGFGPFIGGARTPAPRAHSIKASANLEEPSRKGDPNGYGTGNNAAVSAAELQSSSWSVGTFSLFSFPLLMITLISSLIFLHQRRQSSGMGSLSGGGPMGMMTPTSRDSHRSRASLRTLSMALNDPKVVAASTEALASNQTPKTEYDTIICGGGIAGLLSAIMLARKFGPDHRIAVCERRSAIPPSPADDAVWNDVARFYLLGIGHRGQKALRKFGIWEEFEKYSVAVNGRRDWQPGMTKVEDGKIIPAKKEVVSRILPRDKLVGILHHHIVNNYANSGINLLYGYQADPICFGTEDNDFVSVRISKCNEVDNNADREASEESEESCDVDASQISTTKLLIGADGSARTVANAMEQVDKERTAKINPLIRPFAQKPFKVTRFEDDNPRVYKSVPIKLPADWPCDLNYSARSRDSRITLEALPSDDKGNLCGLLLMKPDDEFAEAHVDPAKLRAFFDEEFPQFGALINDDVMAQVALKGASGLPSFRYAGPRLSMGRRTLVLGDAAHTVKPYFGLGANSAMEDVTMLSDAFDDTSATDDKDGVVPKTVELFSQRRSGDSEALVTMSRNLDRPGKLFFVTFLIPLLLDGFFHKLAPRMFGPNMFKMFERRDLGFKQIQRKKRLDRILQVACIGATLTAMGMGVRLLLRGLMTVSFA